LCSVRLSPLAFFAGAKKSSNNGSIRAGKNAAAIAGKSQVLPAPAPYLLPGLPALRGYRQKQKAVIEEKNKDVLDSIHYAKRIQRSLLPSERYFDRSLKKLVPLLITQHPPRLLQPSFSYIRTP
jgi:hypothetical protein